MIDMSDLINKNASHLAIERSGNKNGPIDGELMKNSLWGKLKGSGIRFKRSQFSTREIDAWMDWIDVHTPDLWIETSHYKCRSKNSSMKFMQDYLNGCSRDRRVKTHIYAMTFGDWQPKRNKRSWHQHTAIWFEPKKELNNFNAALCMKSRWNSKVHGSSKLIDEGDIIVRPYVSEWRGFAYGAGKHKDLDILIGCYGPARCRYEIKRGKECVYKFNS